MRKIKRSSLVSGFWEVWKRPCCSFCPVLQEAPTQSETEGCKSWPGHLWVKGGGEVRDRGRRLSWLEDPESARFRPPSRSRLVQPCRRKAPSPPHLRTTQRRCVFVFMFLTPSSSTSSPPQLLTWDHLDGGVDVLPVLSFLKLPVQDEVAVVSDDGTLRAEKTRLRHSTKSLTRTVYPHLVHNKQICQQQFEFHLITNLEMHW